MHQKALEINKENSKLEDSNIEMFQVEEKRELRFLEGEETTRTIDPLEETI